ncbi:MAG: polyhydroxyalkanoate synthesis regulator DNA-binding domain-containing protein [Chloroflexota bacterium]
MLIIKRYPNRKLYDTEAKRYITLEEMAALIRQGQEVQVVDYATGEDLTTLTLTQIIFEQEKKQSGFLPRPVLTGLIQAGGETLQSLRRGLASPLGLLWQVDEEIERRVRLLVGRGELAEEEGEHLLEKLLAVGGRLRETARLDEKELEQALAARGVPTHDDIQQLLAQLQALSDKLENVTPS